MEHARDDAAAPRSEGADTSDLRRLRAENESLLRRVHELERAARDERRYARLIAESERAEVEPVVSTAPLELQILELERRLALVSLSRPYRLGRKLRTAVARAEAVVARTRPRMLEPVESAPATLPEVDGLPRGAVRPVVFFVPWLAHGGGAERFVHDLARGLVDEGRAVAVVVTAGTPLRMVGATSDMLEVTPHVFDLPRSVDRGDWLAFSRALLTRSDRAVAVNVGSAWFYAHIDALRAGDGGFKVVDELFNHVGHVRQNVGHAAEIDMTVVAHRSLERLLVEFYGVPNPVVTVHVGIHPHARARPPRRAGRPVVGWIGRLSSEKRPASFVELARRLEGTASFRLAGEGPDAAAISAAAETVPSLELLGFVEDNIGFIDGCDLIVITSEVEGISIVAMEAISRGVPVISTDVGGMADLVEPGVNGDLVPPDDFEALVSRVAELIADERALRELQDRVRAAGLADEFTSATMLERFRAILE